MKLIRCHIENFGKLSNLSMEFSDGLNVINQANAWGKSTLAAFLKAMFYGLDAKKEAGAFEKERNLYRPWQGGAFGGELDFEVDGKCYRISRTFGRTEKTDEFYIYDLSTLLESDDYTEEVGLELFDLDSASFKRSIYIAQNDCGSTTSDHINAKLGNLADNTDDINNFETATQRLKELLNQLTPDRVTGSLKKRKNYITQLQQDLRIYDNTEAGMMGVQQKEQLVVSQIQELADIRKSYADALVVASKEARKKELRLQYDALCAEAQEKEAKKDAFQRIFPKGIPTSEEFKAQMHTVRQMESMQHALKNTELNVEDLEQLSILEKMFEKKLPSDEDIDAALGMFAEIDKQKEEIARQDSRLSIMESELHTEVEMPSFEGNIGHKTFWYIGLGIALPGIVALFVWYLNLLPAIEPNAILIPALVAMNCGTILALAGVIMHVNVRKKQDTWQADYMAQHHAAEARFSELAQNVGEMKEDVRKVYATIGNFLGDFRVFCEVGEYQSKLYSLKNQLHVYERLKEQAKQCQKEKDAYQAIREKVLVFVGQYGFACKDEFAVHLNELENQAVAYQSAVAAYNEAVLKKEDFEKRQDKSFWTREAMCPYSIEELNQMIAQADAKIEELKEARSQYLKQLEDLQEQLDMRDEKQSDLDEQLALQEKDAKQYKVTKLTHDFLIKAKEQFTARYMEPISRSFFKYYGMLLGNAQTDWVIDANINLKIREKGELREVKWLSAGYQDLIGVCMRLALVDTMYQSEKPFLILDDPFVNLDKEKVANGNQLLLKVAENYQVIYFTCHDSRTPII